jgi:SOS-response transcriptional repressor LexA
MPHSKRNSYASSDGSLEETMSYGDEQMQRSSSDASHYLRQCQVSSYFNDTARPVRPRYTRASTSHINFSAAPSLSHTPASSYSFSLPYTPATRPLPPRTNHQGTSKSIDLVTPLTSSPKAYSHKAPPILRTSTAAIEGEIMYAKSPVPSLSPANGSLGRLLASSPR